MKTDWKKQIGRLYPAAGRMQKVVAVIVLAAVYLITVSVLYAGEPVTDRQGPFEVRSADNIELTDMSRNRLIPVKVYYPSAKGPFPVIVFSHGLGGSKNTKVYLSRFLTSHGYVCVHMTHFGSDSSLLDVKQTRRENLQKLKKAVRNRQHLLDRALDVSFVIDRLPEIGKRVPGLKEKMDTGRIGVTGHSFGAFTTLMVAGAYADMTEKLLGRRFDDARPLAFLAMSPQSVRPGLDPTQIFSRVVRPFMTMTGSHDLSPADTIKKPEERLVPFRHMPPGNKYALWIEEASHWTFGDRRTISFADGNREVRPDPDDHRVIQQVSLAFWDTYLKNRKTARQYLLSSAGSNSGIRIGRAQARLMQR